jgi:hypothetical protein
VKILKSPGCRSVNSPCGSRILPDPDIVNRKTPVLVKSMETAVEIALAFGKEKSVHPFWLLISWHESFLCRLCPIFRISNVTGEGLDFVSLLSRCPGDDAGLTQIQKQLRTFLNLLPSSEGEEKFTVNQPLEVITYLPLSCCLVESYCVSVFSDRYLVCALCWHSRERHREWRQCEGRGGCAPRPRLQWKLPKHRH